MGPPASDRVSRVRSYSGYTLHFLRFAYGDFTLCVRTFQSASATYYMRCECPQPHTKAWFGLFPVRSPLLRKSMFLSFPPPTKMFQFRGLAHFRVTGLLPAGLSHSEILGSILVCKSPRLIAAYHVFLRLQEPRHPPYALIHFLYPTHKPY